MPTFLSQPWLDLQRELASGLPARPGVSARIQHVVTGAAGGDVRYVTVVADGTIAENVLGVDGQADLTLTATAADAREIATGRLDANAAFMQGRIKVEGAMGPFLELLPLTQTDEYRALQHQLAEATDG